MSHAYKFASGSFHPSVKTLAISTEACKDVSYAASGNISDFALNLYCRRTMECREFGDEKCVSEKKEQPWRMLAPTAERWERCRNAGKIGLPKGSFP